MLVGAFVNDRDLVDRDVCDLVSFISQIENAGLYIHHITAKRRISPACYIDLLTQ